MVSVKKFRKLFIKCNNHLALLSSLESRCLIESDLAGIAKITFSQKVTKMGSITGHKIYYNAAGALRGQRHIPSKTEPKYPPPPPPPPPRSCVPLDFSLTFNNNNNNLFTNSDDIRGLSRK